MKSRICTFTDNFPAFYRQISGFFPANSTGQSVLKWYQGLIKQTALNNQHNITDGDCFVGPFGLSFTSPFEQVTAHEAV